MTSDQFNIVIVGAGLAGLATAHALERGIKEGKGSNVRVKVYEKQEEDTKFSRYPIWLAPEGRSALKNILTPPEFEHLLTLSDNGITHGGIFLLTPTLSNLFSVRRYEGQTPFAIHRWILKDVLEQGVNVQRGRRVVKVNQQYINGESGKIEMVFDNGTHELADMVIGADGQGSSLRAQLYPDIPSFPTLPYLTIQFKLVPPAPLVLPDQHGINNVLGSIAYSLLLIPLSGHPVPALPPSARENNPFSDPTDSEPTMASLDEPNPEYVFCAFSMRVFQGWEDMTPVSWIDKMACTLEDDGADPALVTAVRDGATPLTVGAWQVVCCNEKQEMEWKGGRLVLIGDAAHAMPPQGGAGGATALRDAETLAETILSSAEAGGDGGSLDTLLPVFHRNMMIRGHGYMKDAKRRALLSMKEGWGVLWRGALLRLMSLVWPFAHWVLSRGQVGARAANGATDKKRV